MSDILEQRLDLAETKPVLQKSSSVSLEKPVNDENEDPQHASPTKVKKVVNDRASLEEKEGTADSEKNLESSKVPTTDETGATIAPLSLPTSIPTPIFLKRKMSAKEAIDCTPKRMRFAFSCELCLCFKYNKEKKRTENCAGRRRHHIQMPPVRRR